MKRRRAFCGVLLAALMVLASCGSKEIQNAERTPNLEFAEQLITGVFGEGNYQFEDMENPLINKVEHGWHVFRDYNFYQVYKDKKPFCSIGVNVLLLRNGVKTSEMSTYKQIQILPDGQYELTDKDLL